MRLTELWTRLHETFGPGYAESFARDQVLPQLGGRTVVEALDSHVDVLAVWRAVVAAYPDRVPSRLR